MSLTHFAGWHRLILTIMITGKEIELYYLQKFFQSVKWLTFMLPLVNYTTLRRSKRDKESKDNRTHRKDYFRSSGSSAVLLKLSLMQVYSFLDKMSFYIELYKHKPPDVISHEDGTLWRRQAPKLLYPLGKETALHLFLLKCFGEFSSFFTWLLTHG